MEQLLEKFETMCGLNIQWKAVGTGKTSCGLSERHTYHQCAFCRKVKATPELLHLCSKNDDFLLPRRAEAEQKPFVSTCHAGVSELVIPFFDNGKCRELLLAGIFRERNSSIPCSFLKQDFLQSSPPFCGKNVTLSDLKRRQGPEISAFSARSPGSNRDSQGSSG